MNAANECLSCRTLMQVVWLWLCAGAAGLLSLRIECDSRSRQRVIFIFVSIEFRNTVTEIVIDFWPCARAPMHRLSMKRIIFRPNLDGLKIVVNFDVHAISQRVLHAPRCAPAKLSCSLETITCVHGWFWFHRTIIFYLFPAETDSHRYVCARVPACARVHTQWFSTNACNERWLLIHRVWHHVAYIHICSGANAEHRHNVGHIVEQQHREWNSQKQKNEIKWEGGKKL